MRINLRHIQFYLLILSFPFSQYLVAKPEGDVFNLSLKELLQVKIVGVTRTEQSVKNAPSAVTVFTHEQIKQLGFTYLHELINFVPGFQTHRSGDMPTETAYSARGKKNGVQAKEVLLLLDGIRINAPRNGGANTTLNELPLFNVERIEFIRGPGSSVYGSNAFSGVISITSSINKKLLQIEHGSFNQTKLNASLSYPLNDWALGLNAHYRSDDGDRFNVDDNFSDDPSIRVNTSDPSDSAIIDFRMSNESIDLRFMKASSKSIGFYTVENIADSHQRSSTDSEVINLKYRFSYLDKISSDLSLSRNLTSFSAILQLVAPNGMATISEPSSDAPFIIDFELEGLSSQIKWHNHWDFSQSLNIQFGLEWLEDDETNAVAQNNYDLQQLFNNSFPVTYYGDFLNSTQVGTEEGRSAKSVYFQSILSLTESDELTFGVRVDDYSDAGSHTSPRIGWVKSIGQNHAIKVLYGEAFRAPSLNETQLINNPVLLGNKDLMHESVKTMDLIWTSEWRSSVITINWFKNKYKNPITTGIVSTNTRQFQNGKSNISKGVEVEASFELNNRWFFKAGYTSLFDLPDTAFRESDALFSMIVNYQNSDWNANLSTVYHSQKKQLLDEEFFDIDAFWQLNSHLIYRFSKQTKLYIKGENLLNADIRSAASGNLLSEGIPHRSRAINLGFSFSF